MIGVMNALEQLRDVRERGLERYRYFLLATAVAAIAFAVRETSTAPVKWSQVPLAAAVGFWGYSFWCGCYNIRKTDNLRVVNLYHLQSANPQSPDVISAVKDREDELGPQVLMYGHRQFTSLVTGGVMFVAWHVGEMILRTA
jgi:hypothetical protein